MSSGSIGSAVLVCELLAKCLTVDILPLFGPLSGSFKPLQNFPAFYIAAQGSQK